MLGTTAQLNIGNHGTGMMLQWLKCEENIYKFTELEVLKSEKNLSANVRKVVSKSITLKFRV